MHVLFDTLFIAPGRGLADLAWFLWMFTGLIAVAAADIKLMDLIRASESPREKRHGAKNIVVALLIAVFVWTSVVLFTR